MRKRAVGRKVWALEMPGLGLGFRDATGFGTPLQGAKSRRVGFRVYQPGCRSVYSLWFLRIHFLDFSIYPLCDAALP